MDSKPNYSFSFCDRYQADLINFCEAPALLYHNHTDSGICQWLLVIKDHFTRFIYLRPINGKFASQVAQEIDFYCSIVGYPIIFQTDDGSEFGREVMNALKKINPFMLSLRGKPRTPKHQGSVERGNSVIKRILCKMVHDAKEKLPK